jgi:uncharacterized protein YlxP (DUF503 family)
MIEALARAFGVTFESMLGIDATPPASVAETEEHSQEVRRLEIALASVAADAESLVRALLELLDHVELSKDVRGTIREMIVSRKSA